LGCVLLPLYVAKQPLQTMQFCTVASQEFDNPQLMVPNARIHHTNSTFIHPESLQVFARVLEMWAYYSMMGAAEG